MQNVLIASTYHEDGRPLKSTVLGQQQQIPNKVWLKLQREFIRRNTKSFAFAVYLNTVKNKGLYRNCIIIGENETLIEDARASHRYALRKTIEYFREHKSEYESFCILDSDCFPIKPGWLAHILGSIKKNNLKFAAIVRFENGENFPHPAAIVIPREYIDEDLFNFPDHFSDYVLNTINGENVYDTGVAMSFWDDAGKLIGWPLLRSNVINLHPLYAGVYGDTFYHHGLGSRIRRIQEFDTAIEPYVSYKSKPYWNSYGNFRKDFWIFFELIMHSPKKFINMLRGEGFKHMTNRDLLDYNLLNNQLKNTPKFFFPPFNP